MGATGGPRQGHELAGKRLGLLGFGRAAKGVAVAAGALGMQVHAYSNAQSNLTQTLTLTPTLTLTLLLTPTLALTLALALALALTLAGARLLP